MNKNNSFNTGKQIKDQIVEDIDEILDNAHFKTVHGNSILGEGDIDVVGPTGATGAVGPTGAQGESIIGPTGETGPVGPTGAQGNLGPTGETGSVGPTGADGKPGNNYYTTDKAAPVDLTQDLRVYEDEINNWADNIAVGDIVYLNNSYYGIIINKGNWDSRKYVILNNYVYLRGIQGPTGANGLNGPTGATGPTGLSGAMGPTGAKGPAGETGAVGPTGKTGPTGAEGPTGECGHEGPIGPTGLKGDQGPTGSQGPQGISGSLGPTGPKGADGAKGNEGPTGAMGPTGPKGADGLRGPTGAEGPTGHTVQSDWNQTDSTRDDYIKNKPNLQQIYDDIAPKYDIKHAYQVGDKYIKDEKLYVCLPDTEYLNEIRLIIEKGDDYSGRWCIDDEGKLDCTKRSASNKEPLYACFYTVMPDDPSAKKQSDYAAEAWPGTAMTTVTNPDGTFSYAYVTIPANAVAVCFNSGGSTTIAQADRGNRTLVQSISSLAAGYKTFVVNTDNTWSHVPPQLSCQEGYWIQDVKAQVTDVVTEINKKQNILESGINIKTIQGESILGEGNISVVGPQGPTGAQGEPGPIGPTGRDGYEGKDGPTGPIGPVGPTGPQGPAGAGSIGPTGPTGAPGALGPTGPSIQSDWNQTDTTALDYIKNKPDYIPYSTAEPQADNTNGLKVVVLDTEPANRYDGYLYLVKGAGDYASIDQVYGTNQELIYDGEPLNNNSGTVTFGALKNFALVVMLGYKENKPQPNNSIAVFSPAALDGWGTYTVSMYAGNWSYGLALTKPSVDTSPITWETTVEYSQSNGFLVAKIWGLGRINRE